MRKPAHTLRVGVDTGGTFTDVVVFDGFELRSVKVFSKRDNPAAGIQEGLARLISRPSGPGGCLEIIHGTTVGTNALIERRGSRVALVTTAGFEDLLEIGRQARPRLYDLNVKRERPLAPKERRFGVVERVDAAGRVLCSPSRASLGRLQKQVLKSGAESVALCFLFSFANPEHERRVERSLQETGLPISASYQILPEFREYERLATVVVNAYLVPLMSQYLGGLANRLRSQPIGVSARPAVLALRKSAGQGASGPVTALKNRAPFAEGRNREGAANSLHGYSVGRIYVMQSSGGIAAAERIQMEPVRTILSGPAGGVAAAHWIATLLGLRRIISFDMGGTSTDVCLLGGSPRMTREAVVSGLPIAVPSLDIHTVGAGGGSLARIDAGGALRVGPESAGSNPGPACYGRGGTGPTVTDANLMLGRLDAAHFLGGDYRLDERAAARSFHRFLRRAGRQSPHFTKLRSGIFPLAAGVIAVANANMERALRTVSVERGHDAREFTLVSFGGSGGLHAADLARSLGIRAIVIPPHPGAFSAFGVLLSDLVRDVSLSVLLPVPSAVRPQKSPGLRRFLLELHSRFQKLEQEGREALRREQLASDLAHARRWLDVRYAGQGYELSIPMSPRLAADFDAAHCKAYGHSQPGHPLEVVSLRLRLTIPTAKPRVRARRPGPTDATPAVIGQKSVWYAGKAIRSSVYARDLLRAGMRIPGPAVITEYGSTTWVPPDFVCHTDRYLDLVLERHAR